MRAFSLPRAISRTSLHFIAANSSGFLCTVTDHNSFTDLVIARRVS
jgi:hypothetical protein